MFLNQHEERGSQAQFGLCLILGGEGREEVPSLQVHPPVLYFMAPQLSTPVPLYLCEAHGVMCGVGVPIVDGGCHSTMWEAKGVIP